MIEIVSFVLLLIGCCSPAVTLKCRSQENGSEIELKRITRNCIQKIGEIGPSSNNKNIYISNNYQRYGNKQNEASSSEIFNRWDNINYDNNHQSYGSYNLNNNLMVQRNRQRQNDDSSLGHIRASTLNNSGNSIDRKRFSNSKGAQQGTYSFNRNSSLFNRNENCIAHCFFLQLKTLNIDDYPDRQKVNYMLTKNLRDHELRNFYNDTIEECFHYMDSQRQRDGKCSYSNDLIRCMNEYAKANCDDWQAYNNIIFN